MVTKLMPAVAALALVVAACSGNADAGVASLEDQPAATDADDGQGATVSDEEALLAFAGCMRDHGIEGFEDPTVDDEGNLQFGDRGGFGAGEIDRETMIAARNACSEHLEDATLGFGRPDDAEIQDLLLAFAECMRDQGIEMDDPDLSGFGPGGNGEPGQGGGPFGDIDVADPDVLEALEACQSDFGRGFGPGGGGPGRPGGGDGGGQA